MPIISDTRNWSDFNKFQNSTEPLKSAPVGKSMNNSIFGSPAQLHPAVQKFNANQNFLKDFQPSGSVKFNNEPIHSPANPNQWTFNPSGRNDFITSPSGNISQPLTQNSNITSHRTPFSDFKQTTMHDSLRNHWDDIESRVNRNAEEMTSGVGTETPSGTDTPSKTMIGVDEVAKLAQDVGRGGVDVFSSIKGGQYNEKYIRNSMQPGIHAGLQANITKAQDDARNAKTASFGKLGALFGPAGAALGAGIGALISSSKSANSDLYKTAYSAQGKVNPQDSGIVSGNSTASASGESQQET